MAEVLKAWPLDNTEYTAEALGAAYAARTRGVLTAASFGLAPAGGNNVRIEPGIACLHRTELWALFPAMQAAATLTLDASDGSFDRIDTVALIYDKNANSVALDVRKGIAQSNPAPVALRRDADYDEVHLYHIRRPAGSLAITADLVTDLRLNPALCGLMRDSLDQIDTAVMEASWTAWFDRIKGLLTTDQAGNLQTQIDNLRTISVTLTATGWSAGKPYTQTVAVPGMTAAREYGPPWIVPTGVESTDAAAAEALAAIRGGETSDGAITFWCKADEDKPAVDITISLQEVQRA